MKNKDGFTLVELLVCIVIIASLAIVLAINSQGLINSGTQKQDKSTMENIFNASAVYFNTKGFSDSNSTVTLKQLIESGLVDEKLLQQINPLYEEKKFTNYDYIEQKYISGKKILTFISDDKCLVNQNIDDFDKWGDC